MNPMLQYLALGLFLTVSLLHWICGRFAVSQLKTVSFSSLPLPSCSRCNCCIAGYQRTQKLPLSICEHINAFTALGAITGKYN